MTPRPEGLEAIVFVLMTPVHMAQSFWWLGLIGAGLTACVWPWVREVVGR